ncbi:helix-turn-helix domain-containing protein [Mesorhizobium xinjiangense]|uniref:helix-turn-helix domain-containing protein n=1 Tax=Mesorhizobium xinjiangense TaxID=2678685 RepID=UPI0012EE115A|nr:helix-turn-helix transcriptional regulator [Mesorhizobium xinjiangense]
MTKQIITTPNGERMVVLPEGEYQSLLEAAEEAEDLAAIHRFEEKLAAGEEELVPAEFVHRMLEGESPVLVWREYRGLSARALAEAAGISQAYLSQIESGKRDGTIGTMKKIAEALKVTIDELV